MKMKKRLCALLAMLVLFCIMAVPAWADMGPKPTVDLTFKGLEGQQYAVALISRIEYTPAPWMGDGWDAYNPEDGKKENWQALHDYVDPDGCKFGGYWEECSESHHFRWDYRAPSRFKILIWLEDTQTYLVSEELDRYAFDAYFTVQYTPEGTLQVKRSYDYTWELISLVCRVVLTIAIELVLAWMIGWRARRDMQVLLWTNVVTQLGLNIALNVTNYMQGSLAFAFAFFAFELIVFVIEGAVYQYLLRRDPHTGKKRHVWLYALGANGVSMLLGFKLAQWIPGIF